MNLKIYWTGMPLALNGLLLRNDFVQLGRHGLFRWDCFHRLVVHEDLQSIFINADYLDDLCQLNIALPGDRSDKGL